MDANPGKFQFFPPPSGTGLWIGSLGPGIQLNTGESIRFFISDDAATAGPVAWKVLEHDGDVSAGRWPQTGSRALLALVDARNQDLEAWIPERTGDCRIVCVEEPALSLDCFLRCAISFDYLGIGGTWIPNPLAANGNLGSDPWRVFRRLVKDCQVVEGIAGALQVFDDLILYRISAEGIIRYITPNVARYGFDFGEIVGTPLMRFVHPEDLPVVAQSFVDFDALRNRQVRFRVMGPRGDVFHVCTTSRFLTAADGEMELVGIMREETGKMQASLQLERARRIGSVMHQVSGVLFGAASLEDLCSSICRILVEEESIIMALVQDARNPGVALGVWHESCRNECRGFLSREFLEFLGQREIVQPEVIPVSQYEGDFKRFLMKTDLSGVRSILAVPLFYPGHRFSGKLHLFAQSADAFNEQTIELTRQAAMLLTHGVMAVLDREEAERSRKRLAASEEHHRRILSNIRDIIYSFDAGGQLQFISENVREILGMDPSKLEGKSFLEVIRLFNGVDARIFEKLQADFDAAVRECKPEIFNSITMGEGKDRRFLENRERIFYDANGSLQGSVGVLRDITQQVRVQEELERSEQKYRLLFEMSQDALFIEDLDGRILECNEAALRMYGFSRGEMLQLTAHDLVPDSIAGMFPELLQRIRDVGAFRVEAMGRCRDGSEFPSEVMARVFHLEGKDLLMLSVRDISEFKRREQERIAAERRLRHSQKMESVALLVSRLAHDFNNLLVGILGNASIGLMETVAENPTRMLFEEIEKAAEEAAMISRQLLMYAGGWKPRLQPLNLAEILERTAKDMQSAIPGNVRVVYRIEPGVFPVNADPEQCAILVSHLMSNGIDAVKPSGGLVTVSLFSCGELPENPVLEIAPDDVVRRGDWVCLEVADSGCGIAHQHLEKIFDPFFTTKESASGLGLAAVAGIVRHHGAVLQVMRLGERGTAFHVFFAADKNREDVLLPLKAEGESVEEGVILLVDDDFWVRTVGKRMLDSAGRPCQVMSGGREALAFAAKNPEKIRLVVLDLHLPDISGMEVYAQLRALRPKLPILVSSGWSGSIEPFWDPAYTSCTGILVKPYTAPTFLQAIEALEKSAATENFS